MLNDFSIYNYELHPEIGKLVEESINQIENGEFYTQDEMKEKVKSWV